MKKKSKKPGIGPGKHIQHNDKNDKGSKRPLSFWVIFLGVVFLDQVTKYLVRDTLILGSSKTLIGGVFSLTYLGNTGASFGLFKGMNLLFIIVSFFVLALFDYVYIKNKKYGVQIALICAGIAGNLIDRLTLGYVVDFFDFRIWPVFNIADSAISIGVLWLIILVVINKDDLL